MDFAFSDLEALNNLLNPEDDQAPDPYSSIPSGSALTPGDVSGRRKELAPPLVKVEAKVNRSGVPPAVSKPKQEIWQEEDLSRRDAELSDDRPEPEDDLQLRQRVGPEDIFLGLSDMDPSSRHCQDLLIRVKLPGTKYKDIGLDVEKRMVKLQAPKFKLNLALPYPVLDQQGSAKWLSTLETLEVALPIDKSDIPLYAWTLKTTVETSWAPRTAGEWQAGPPPSLHR